MPSSWYIYSDSIHCSLSSLQSPFCLFDFLCHMFAFVSGCFEGEILPLVGGASSQQGFVQICVGGNYHPVTMTTFNVEEAAVICRTMGLGSGMSSIE